MIIKNQKGITLIALVVTIIVLIILAGISINLLFGDNGIIKKAQNASEISQKADIEEKLKLAYSSVVIDKYTEGITDLSSRLQSELQKSFPGNDVSVEKKSGNYQVIIQGKGTFSIGESGNTEEVRLSGFYRDNGDYISWQELINRNLILVDGTILKYDEDRVDNDIMVYDAKDWVGTMVIDDSITEIEWSVFNYLPGIKRIVIPASVTQIDSEAFDTFYYELENGEEKTICLEAYEVAEENMIFKSVNGVLYSKDMKELYNVPDSFTGTFEIPNTVEFIGEYAFSFSKISSVVIPHSVQELDFGVFSYCDNITEINLPNSITAYPSGGISFGCTKLLNINMESGSSSYKSVDGVLFSTNGKLLYEFPKGRTGEYVVPNGVVNIKNGAFHRSLLSNIVIPSSVLYIEGRGIAARNFDHVVLPDGIKKLGWAIAGERWDGENRGCYDVTYKGVTYTSKSALVSALTSNGVNLYDDDAFEYSNLGE